MKNGCLYCGAYDNDKVNEEELLDMLDDKEGYLAMNGESDEYKEYCNDYCEEKSDMELLDKVLQEETDE